MGTQTGPIDHPSYLTRQFIGLGKSTAGANGTSCLKGFWSNIRIRNVSCVVATAGTSTQIGNQALLYVLGTCTTFNASGVGTVGTATTSVGVFVLGTSAVNTVSTSGDLNVEINQGSVFFAKNGTDATGVFDLVAEGYIDPVQGSWTAGQ